LIHFFKQQSKAIFRKYQNKNKNAAVNQTICGSLLFSKNRLIYGSLLFSKKNDK